MTEPRVTAERLAEMIQGIEDDPEGVDGEEYMVLYELRDRRISEAALEQRIAALEQERDAARAQVAQLREMLEWAVEDMRSIGVADSGWPEAWGESGTRMEQIAKALAATTDAQQWLAEQIERARSEAFEECARMAEVPYGDEVGAFGPDEPLAVGAKIARAIRAKAAHDAKGAGDA